MCKIKLNDKISKFVLSTAGADLRKGVPGLRLALHALKPAKNMFSLYNQPQKH